MVARIFKTYGQGVDLILNSENGLSMGPELLTNGDFSVGLGGWSVSNALADNTISVVDGKLSFTRTVSGFESMFAIHPTFTGGGGKKYMLQADYTQTQSIAGRLQVIGSPYFAYTFGCSVGPNSFVFDVPEGTSSFYVRAQHAGQTGSTVPNTITFDNISLREIIGADRAAVQANTSLQPLLGRAPVRGRVNLLNGSTIFSSWAVTNATWGVGDVAVGFGNPSSKLTPVAGSTALLTTGPSIGIGSNGVLSFVLRPKNISSLDLGVTTTNKRARVSYNPTTHAMGISTAANATIYDFGYKLLGDGWVEVWLRAGSGFSMALYIGASYADASTASLELASRQLENGTLTPTRTQVVSGDGFDVTERNLSSPGYLRFDLTDDKLTHTFPDGFNGDVFIAGRNGSWVESGITIAAGGTMDIGPTSITGGPTPGILRALGDIVGWVPVGRTLTEDDKAALVAHFRTKGAKGLLVPSNNDLVINGTFVSDLSTWVTTSWVHDPSERAYLNTALNYQTLTYQTNNSPFGGMQYGKAYRVSFDYEVIAGLLNFALNSSNSYSTTVGGSGTKDFILVRPFDARTSEFVFRNLTGASEAYIDNVSVRELIPQEEL